MVSVSTATSEWIQRNHDSLHGVAILAVPQLGKEVVVALSDNNLINLGPCVEASYEDGSGRKFCVRTRVMSKTLFVKLPEGIDGGNNPFRT